MRNISRKALLAKEVLKRSNDCYIDADCISKFNVVLKNCENLLQKSLTFSQQKKVYS